MNAQQREAVYCRNNAVIAAGAGSGKTTVLANRFLRLITCEGVPVEKILCLTFTKKATAEMYHRIYTGLTSLAADTGADSLVQRLAAHAAANFYLANIQTLDAYCAKVVRAAAPRYGIRPDFSGDARTAAALVAREALPFVISNRAHPALKTLYRIKKTDEIARVYFAEAVSKYDALGDPADFTGDLQKQMRHIAGADVWDAHRSPAAACLEQLAEASPQAGGVTLEPLTVSAGELAAYFDDLLNHDEYDCIAAAAASDTYKKLLRELTMLCALARLNLTTVPKDARDALRELRAQFPCLSALLVFCTEAAFMLSLSRLQTRFQQHITEQKRRNGILSFQDTASLARKALLEQKDLRQSEKNAFQAVIIDEFQDNNALQKDLLFLIAEKPCLSDDGIPPPEALAENKLFFVGDQKQSIYKFRGADVSVFRRLENAFSGGCLSLSVNYRSHSRLIAVFNALFGGQWPETADTAAGDGAAGDGARPQVFVPSAGDVPLYEAVYEPLLAGRADGPPPSSPPPEGIPPEGTFTVCLLPAPSARGGSAGGDDSGEDDDGEEAAVEKEAAFVAQKIAGLIAGGRRPDDIAILTRAHTNEYIYEKHLRAAAVPYKNENRAGGLAIEPVHDLLCALRLAVYPMDTLNYAAFLRSPFAGLSLPASAALAGHAAAGGGPFGEGALELLDDRDRERFDHGAALYRELCARAASSSIAELLRFLWFDAGYRYEVEWHEQTAASRELYDVLFTLAVKAGSAGVSLAAWTDTVKAAQQTGKFRRLVRDENALDGLDI
ncbi:MAG: UvrD-helicase domain-containing protein, partial [Spirochaetaceae bacterium]|nr:UvrD-helicase domain-containing protein [Spirochaetaceae bacterium]